MNIGFLCLVLLEYVLVLKYPDYPHKQKTTENGLEGGIVFGKSIEKAHFGMRPKEEGVEVANSENNTEVHFIDAKARVYIPMTYIIIVLVIFMGVYIKCYA